jgi:hypothetical protein
MRRAQRCLLAGLLALLATTWAARADVVINGSPGFTAAVEECLEKIASSAAGGGILSGLESSSNTVVIQENSGLGSTTYDSGKDAKSTDAGGTGKGSGSTVSWDPTFPYTYKDGVKRDPCSALFHELVHASDADKGKLDKRDGGNGIGADEVHACTEENKYRKEQGLPPRTKYGDKDLPPSAIPKAAELIQQGGNP